MFFLLFCLIFSDKVTHLFKIEMLETTVSGIMEEHHNQHHLCLRGIVESCDIFSCLSVFCGIFCHHCIKKLSEII